MCGPLPPSLVLGQGTFLMTQILNEVFFYFHGKLACEKIKCLHRDAMFLSGWSSESLASEWFRVGLVGLWLCKTLLWVVSYEKSCHGILAVRKWKAIWWNSHGFFWNWLVDPTRLGFWLFKKTKAKKKPNKTLSYGVPAPTQWAASYIALLLTVAGFLFWWRVGS